MHSNRTNYINMSCHVVCTLSMVMSLVGLASQIVSFLVVWRIRVKARLFTYMIAYTINNAIVCTLIINNKFIQLIHSAYLTHSYAMSIYMAKIILPMLSFCYQNTFFFLILIMLDMLSNFHTGLEKLMKKHSPERNCFIMTLLNLFTSLPFFFIFQVQQQPVGLTEQIGWRITTNPFFTTRLGFSIIIFVIVLFDILIVPIQIGLNICSIVCVKRHIRSKTNRATNQSLLAQYQNADLRTTLMLGLFSILSLSEHILRILSTLGVFHFSDSWPLEGIESVCTLFIVSVRSLSFLFGLLFNRVMRDEFFKILKSF